jgi:hypothetical protein
LSIFRVDVDEKLFEESRNTGEDVDILDGMKDFYPLDQNYAYIVIPGYFELLANVIYQCV